MAVTAALVKELRERTGLGIMDCKKALVETDGNIETAIENLRKSSQVKAAKKAGRTAAEGAVNIAVIDGGKVGIMVEVNSETDFVSRDDNFKKFVAIIVARVGETRETDIEKLMTLPSENGSEISLEDTRLALVQKIGENIQVRRAVIVSAEGALGAYTHDDRIGVLLALNGGDEILGKDVAMHVAATNPLVVNPGDVSSEILDKEKEIFTAQAKESGKPDNIIEKMIEGRVKKYLAEVSLVEQAFVKDPDTKIGALVKKQGAEVAQFVRYEVGEGIEKEVVDFAEEVRAQVEGS